jgi:hypothetical protein
MKPILQNALIVIAATTLSLVVLEGAAKLYSGRSIEGSFWIYSSDKTVKFDPIAGFRLTTDVTLEARISNGVAEYVGSLHGNNKGFPSRAFLPTRTDRRIRRYAVFGDSFSQGEFYVRNWPDYAENLTMDDVQPIQFLNFSLNATGLANWWSIIINEVSNYDLDGVIFADFGNDLDRPFTMMHMADKKFRIGRLPFWDPTLYPKTFDAAEPYLPDGERYFRYYIFDEPNFLRALSGEWHPDEWFVQQQYRAVESRLQSFPAPTRPSGDDERWRQLMMADIAKWIATRKLDARVIYIPSRDELLARQSNSNYKLDAQRFSQVIGASFYDGSNLYVGMNDDAIRAHFFPYDAHWNLAGADLFATYVVGILRK